MYNSLIFAYFCCVHSYCCYDEKRMQEKEKRMRKKREKRELEEQLAGVRGSEPFYVRSCSSYTTATSSSLLPSSDKVNLTYLLVTYLIKINLRRLGKYVYF